MCDDDLFFDLRLFFENIISHPDRGIFKGRQISNFFLKNAQQFYFFFEENRRKRVERKN